MIDSDVIFIGLEFIYLCAFLLSIFKPNRFLIWFAYGLAGLKFSISSLATFDIINYQNIYDLSNQISLDNVQGNIEGSFVSLLYIAKNLHISLTAFHASLIILFLISINFMLKAFYSSQRADQLTLLFGFFSVNGEIGLYLLRQLLSTSVIFFALGFLFRGQRLWGLITFLVSLLLHTTSLIYAPFFVSAFVRNKILRAIVLILLFGYVVFLISNFEIGGQIISSVAGDESLQYSKYNNYTSFSGTSGWRDRGVGSLTFLLLFTFISLIVIRFKVLLKSNIGNYYFLTFIITVFYLTTLSLRLFWISSRFNFISTMLLLSSSVFIIIDMFSKKDYRIIIACVSVALFAVSLVIINTGYTVHGLFQL